MLKVAVLMAACLCVLCESQSDMLEKRDSARRYCGRNLADVMHIVCNGIYNGNPRAATQKKSWPDAEDDLWPVEEQADFPFRSRASAHRILKRQSPIGIAYECCINKGCTIHELRTYCGR
ncbi:LIRP-like [Periplaneta americana]|uniref:LIRP-like n=1 Tax=Periplaneta americana TaxID=6978 RepID=UPI0037E8FFA3